MRVHPRDIPVYPRDVPVYLRDILGTSRGCSRVSQGYPRDILGTSRGNLMRSI